MRSAARSGARRSIAALGSATVSLCAAGATVATASIAARTADTVFGRPRPTGAAVNALGHRPSAVDCHIRTFRLDLDAGSGDLGEAPLQLFKGSDLDLFLASAADTGNFCDILDAKIDAEAFQ